MGDVWTTSTTPITNAAVRDAQTSVFQQEINAAIPAHTARLGRRLDDHTMVTSGRHNAMERAVQAVLARADAIRRSEAADSLRHEQEVERKRTRETSAKAEAGRLSASDAQNQIITAMWAVI